MAELLFTKLSKHQYFYRPFKALILNSFTEAFLITQFKRHAAKILSGDGFLVVLARGLGW